MKTHFKWRIAVCLTVLIGTRLVADENEAVQKGFVYTEAPFPECHASTIEETKSGLVCAWFGGKHEKDPSVGIWLSRFEDEKWTTPVEVANGNRSRGPVKRYACWNPVLFQPKEGPLLLFFKVGLSPREWHGEIITSHDGGQTWTTARELPDGFLGPIKNKPIQLSNGSILCPSSTEEDGWRVHFEFTNNDATNWTKTAPVNDGKQFGIIQPTILTLQDDRLLALCRSRQRVVVGLTSSDQGKTWSDPYATSLPNPNAGFDGVTMTDGRQALVYNPTEKGRTPLCLAISDDGKQWKDVVTLESDPGEYSYPAVIQDSKRMLQITYTWKRERVRHVVVDPSRL